MTMGDKVMDTWTGQIVTVVAGAQTVGHTTVQFNSGDTASVRTECLLSLCGCPQ